MQELMKMEHEAKVKRIEQDMERRQKEIEDKAKQE